MAEHLGDSEEWGRLQLGLHGSQTLVSRVFSLNGGGSTVGVIRPRHANQTPDRTRERIPGTRPRDGTAR